MQSYFVALTIDADQNTVMSDLNQFGFVNVKQKDRSTIIAEHLEVFNKIPKCIEEHKNIIAFGPSNHYKEYEYPF